MTIVVLIILATVSINAVFSENGLIKQAEKAKEAQRAATVQDEVSMWKAEKTLGKYTDTTVTSRDELLADLVADKLITEEEKATIEETGSVTIGGIVIEFGSNARTLVEMFEAGELQIGDYVNFPNPTSGTKTVSAADSGMSNAGLELTQTYNASDNQLNWRVLGIDKETGGLKLIAGAPMKSARVSTANDPYFYLYGAQACITEDNGEIKAVNLLNDICSMYANDLTVEARSVNMDDVNGITGIDTDDEIKAVNGDYHFNSWKQYGDSYSFADQYTPESWLNNKTKTTVEGTVDGYWYTINSSDSPTVTVSDTTLYNLLFNNVDFTGGENQGACYWLASSGVLAGSSYAYFGPGTVGAAGGTTYAGTGNLFDSYGNEGRYGCAVRPVVVLNSDVTEEDIQEITTTVTEETWNYTMNPGG